MTDDPMIRAVLDWRLPERHNWPLRRPRSPFIRGLLTGLTYGPLVAVVWGWMLAWLLT